MTGVGEGSAVGVVDVVVGSDGTVVLHGIRATTVTGAAQVHVVATDGTPFDVTAGTRVVASRGALPFTGAEAVGVGIGAGVAAVLTGVLLVHTARRRRPGPA